MSERQGDERRLSFDFEIDFLNGGGLQGQGFRLDWHGNHVADDTVARALVGDLRLLMVRSVRIRNKQLIIEPHKRPLPRQPALGARAPRCIDLSHTIEHGMVTYPGLPAPHVCDFLSREASRRLYSAGTEFQIGRIDMVANTGTYLDSPFHRFAEGSDISQLALPQLAELDAVVARVLGSDSRAIDAPALAALELAGKAVLIHSGWARHWGTGQYFDRHPYLTEGAARLLREQGAALVGIDSLNIDDTADGRRPVHTILLGAGIPIVEHLRGLELLPAAGFRFSAVPPAVKGMGTFPVRAFATVS